MRLLSYALSDPLTGLPNRRAIYEELERLQGRALREGGSILVGVIDLDGFKSINDVHGHQNGDIFLQEMGAGWPRLCAPPTCWAGWAATSSC